MSEIERGAGGEPRETLADEASPERLAAPSSDVPSDVGTPAAVEDGGDREDARSGVDAGPGEGDRDVMGGKGSSDEAVDEVVRGDADTRVVTAEAAGPPRGAGVVTTTTTRTDALTGDTVTTTTTYSVPVPWSPVSSAHPRPVG